MKRFFCILIALMLVFPLVANAAGDFVVNKSHSAYYKVAGFSDGGIAYEVKENFTLKDTTIGGYNTAILIDADNVTIDIENCEIYCWHGIIVKGNNVILNIKDSKIVCETETAQQKAVNGYGAAIRFDSNCSYGNILNIENSAIENYALPNISNNDQISALIDIKSNSLSAINLSDVTFSDNANKAKWVFKCDDEEYVKSILKGDYKLTGTLFEFERVVYYSENESYVFTRTLQEAVTKIEDRTEKDHTIHLLNDNKEDIVFSSGYFTIDKNGYRYLGDVSFKGDDYNLNFEKIVDRDEPNLVTYQTLTPAVYVSYKDGSSKGYVSLEDAIISSKDGAKITLEEDTELTDTIVHNAHVYIDMAGYTLTLNGKIDVMKNAALEFIGKGTIDGTGYFDGDGVYLFNDIELENKLHIVSGYYDRDITNWIDLYYYDCKNVDGLYTPYIIDLPEGSTYKIEYLPFNPYKIVSDTNTGLDKVIYSPSQKTGNITVSPFNSESNVFADIHVANYEFTLKDVDYKAFKANSSKHDMYIDLSRIDIDKIPYIKINSSVVVGILDSLLPNETLTINTKDYKLTLDQKAFASLASQRQNGELELYVSVGTEKDVPKPYIDALGKEILASVNIVAYGRANNIEDLTDGTITLEIPFDIEKDNLEAYTINNKLKINKQVVQCAQKTLKITSENINFLVIL